MYIYRRMHFRASDPRIEERRLFASRHLVAKPAVLFTYLPPCYAVCVCVYVCMCVSGVRARSFIDFLCSFCLFLFRIKTFSRTRRKIANMYKEFKYQV